MQLVSWRATGIAVLAGFIAAVSGMIMWITSANYIRVRFFDLFYRAHHLYLVFVVFFVFHVGVQSAGYAMGSIILFFIDRYMRFWQSRRLLTASSVRILHDNIVELKFLKSPGIHVCCTAHESKRDCRSAAAQGMRIVLKS